MKKILLFCFLMLMPLQVLAIDFVRIGNPANKPASNGKGAVFYTYDISKYEITNAEYCDFLNSVAAENDCHGLFSPFMEEHFFGGIMRNCVGNRTVYKVKGGYDRLPVVGVTWMSAVRYCNWLHYKSLNKGDLTEGDATYGAYDTRSVPTKRNRGARYWLPNEDEWLKAAYYDGKGWNESFFPKGSNCYQKNGWAYPFPHLKAVGAHVEPSHYGTYDQQGNAAEWIENARKGDEKWKLALGGNVVRPKSFAGFNESEGDFPEKSISAFGMRICRAADAWQHASTEASDYMPAPCAKGKGGKMAYKKDHQGDCYMEVGDASNVGDQVNGFAGRVNYDYYIARTELSTESYCRFLNAVAKYGDPYSLYDTNMETGACGGIIRQTVKGVSTYRCKEGWGDKPVVYVHYYDICRYANWLHYGCPKTGRSVLGTTEGTAELGAYDTRDFEEVRMGRKVPYEAFGKRNVGARFWIPSGDEWYKAAYYDPTCVGSRKYHDYPTRSSDEPTLAQANYMVGNHLSVGAPFYVAPVDSFENAASYYGTLQQGGNVWEWTEDWQYGNIGSRGLRGGSWSYTMYGLNACNVDPSTLNYSGYVFGARLCMAANFDGWHPVETPFVDALYEWVLLLPKKRLVFAVLFIGLMAVVSFMTVVVLGLYIIRKSKKNYVC